MKKNGFTLVELLAVIAILGLILVIAVPKVTNIMENSKKRTLELSVKSIAKSAEETYLENESFGIDEEITCESVSNISNDQYETCEITFDGEGNASVIFVGKGSYEGLYVCNGTKTSATAIKESCTLITLIVDLDGGTDNVDYNPKYEAESNVTLIQPTKEGYVFNGWTVTGTGASVNGNKLTMGSETTTVTATWKSPSAADTIAAKVGTGGLQRTSATYTNASNEEVTVDAGLRYVGALTGDNAVKNQVYFNCEDEYTSGDKTIKYGDEDYVYKDHCEVWRIIGVFEVEDGNGKKEPRIKIININSTFEASWDSSASETNSGYGVNQWGPSTLTDGSAYLGADLMQLLNGYYIEKNDSTIATADKKECKYNTGSGQSGFSETCDTTDASLSSLNMKPLTSTALSMIDEAVWYTYATDTSTAATAYLQERGITKKYTGCIKNEATTTTQCTTDGVTRNNKWIGLIGLMSVSDIRYANGWLYNGSIYPWSITPGSYSSNSPDVWRSYYSNAYCDVPRSSYGVWPAAYLSSNVQIIGGDGTEGNAYKLSVNSGQ